MPLLPSPLVTPEALLERLGDPRVVVADVRWYLTDPARGRREYEAGHIPGAVFVDVDADLVGPSGPGRHPLPDPATFARRMGELGIADGTSVVAYDDTGGGNAARLWWMLDDLGHAGAGVLDGGVAAWVAAGGALSTDRVALPRRPPLRLASAWTRVIRREELATALGRVLLLDGRARERYRGEVEPVDPVAGHIPTAVSHPIAENIGSGGRFLPASELAARFRDLGADAGHEVVTSCGSGVNACQTALAMRLAGLARPLLYEGSYSDWSRSGCPIATGDDPGVAPDLSGP